jgi:hypothetical protein
LLTQQGAVATLTTELQQAKHDAEAAEVLLRQELISRFDAAHKQALAAELRTRMALEQERLAMLRAANDSQLVRQAAQVERLRAIAEFQRGRVASLTVVAPATGVVQDLALQPGQWVTEGTMLAKVFQPGRLKAVLRIAEQQARDVAIGQEARIDTRGGIVRGRVNRKDPAAQAGYVAVDVALPEELPRGVVPDLAVDGDIDVERVGVVLQVGRPARLPASGAMSLFRIDRDGRGASRVSVQLGRASLTAVEVRSGLAPGDQVILSSLPEWDGAERLRLKHGSNR